MGHSLASVSGGGAAVLYGGFNGLTLSKAVMLLNYEAAGAEFEWIGVKVDSKVPAWPEGG